VPGSRPPCDLHIVDICRRLDELVKRTWGQGGGTELGLRTLAAADYAPDDVRTLQQRTRDLLAITAEALDILDDSERPIPLRRCCPIADCGSLWRYLPGGERKWALVADSSGVRCLVCRADWPQERWGLLAEMLGA